MLHIIAEVVFTFARIGVKKFSISFAETMTQARIIYMTEPYQTFLQLYKVRMKFIHVYQFKYNVKQ